MTYSILRVKRLARKAILAGIKPNSGADLYCFLSKTGDQDLNNLVLIELGWWKP